MHFLAAQCRNIFCACIYPNFKTGGLENFSVGPYCCVNLGPCPLYIANLMLVAGGPVCLCFKMFIESLLSVAYKCFIHTVVTSSSLSLCPFVRLSVACEIWRWAGAFRIVSDTLVVSAFEGRTDDKYNKWGLCAWNKLFIIIIFYAQSKLLLILINHYYYFYKYIIYY